MHLQSSVIELESSLVQLKNSLICLQYEKKNVGIRELFNSIIEFSSWIRQLCNSFKDKLI